MKKMFLSTLALAIITISLIAHANPPNAIHAKYDYARQELNIIVQHPVTNPTKHFIKEVEIYKNNREIEKKMFNFQTSHRNQTIPPIKIAASPDDEIKIIAICNKFGFAEKTIQVKADQ